MKRALYIGSSAVLALSAILASGVLTGGFAASKSQTNNQIAADVSPVPNNAKNFISSGDGSKIINTAESQVLGFVQREDPNLPPKANCSRKAIIYYAKKAPENFKEARKGLLFGVRTHTNATAINTPIGRFAGFNSCALVASAIMRKAGCRWMSITANAKSVYDAAYRVGWRPTLYQDGGCIVAWNARWEGERPRIGRGVHAKLLPKNRVMFRHVGVTTGSNMSVDNSGITSRPSESSTYRPIRYEPPIYLCPNFKSAKRKKKY